MATGIITQIINNDNVEIEEYKNLIEPGMLLKITYSLSNYSTDVSHSYYIRVRSGLISEDFVIEFDDNGPISPYLLQMPTLYSNTNIINFQLIEKILDSNNGNSESPELYNLTLNNYIFPFIIEKDIVKLSRCNNDYNNNPYGPLVKADEIRFNLVGSLEQIDSISIKVNKSASSATDVLVPLPASIYSSLFNNGYSDNNNNYIFSELNQNEYFKETKFSYSFDFIFKYTVRIIKNDIEYGEQIKYYTIANIGLEQSFTSLQLVGKTLLSNGDIVYGGIAIGQNPTINTIGEPAFECGYPTYLNNGLNINGMRYGYYPGDEYEVYPSQSVYGYVGAKSTDLAVTFNLGQPIFANDFDITGNFVGRAYRELSGAKLASPYNIDSETTTINKQIVNQKAGIIVVIFTKKKGDWGSSDQNNRAAVITSGTENIKITFK